MREDLLRPEGDPDRVLAGKLDRLVVELVWSDCVPPRTAASAWTVVRTTFSSGCCAVHEQPAVCVWKRSQRERSRFAPNSSRITRSQTRRAARNFAISSKKSLWELKKNESRGANSSTSSPRAVASATYVRPSASVNASSWTAVDPASRMW